MEIIFNYEYDCGGHVYSHTVDIGTEEFENDTLLVLVCSYMQSWGGYPGSIIDLYLHNRFPAVHTLDDMHGFYKVYSCTVEHLKPFNEVADILLGMSYSEGEKEVEKLCNEYNNQFKGKARENQSIWDIY